MNQVAQILLVEDDLGYADLAKEAFRLTGTRGRLHVVSDGIQALEYLRRMGPYQGAARPDLVLLDLNMPKKNGHEVLAEIKQDKELKAIPVVILSTSEDEKDIFSTYRSGANCYVIKPDNLDEFVKILKSVGYFWLTMAKLPRLPGAA